MTFEVSAVREDRLTPSPYARFQQPWVPYPAGIEAMKTMARLIKLPHEGRPENLAIIGGPNFGKSHLLDHFCDCYPDLPDDPIPRMQVLYTETPIKADGSSLLRQMLRDMGARFDRRAPADELLDMFCTRAESLRILMLVLDEFSNGAWGRREASVTLVATVRALSNRLGRPIVIAGTDKVVDVLRNDSQLSQRFCQLNLPQWKTLKDVKDLVATIRPTLDPAVSTELGPDETALLVMNIAGPKLGRIVVLYRKAIALALSKGEPLAERHFHAVAGQLPGSKDG